MKRAALLALTLAVLSGVAAAADDDDKPRRRIRLGGISVGAGYSHMSGPGFYPGFYSPYWGPAWMSAWRAPWIGSYWFDPWFMTPYIHPAFYTGFGYAPNLGEVRLRATIDKAADVYLDGALAGKAGKLKSMWLEPGAYELTIKSGDQTEFAKKIYVLTGKRFDVEPEGSQR